MCGSFLRRGTDFCAQYLRLASSIARKLSLSLVVLFVDIESALATATRSLIVPQQISDEYIVSVFQKLGFADCMFQEFCETMKAVSAVELAGVPAPLIKILSCFALNSSFVMNGLSKFVSYNNGTGAGTPIADLLFIFLWRVF